MQKIKADLFKQMMFTGAHNLEINRAAVDALNVFPVPDGDTGTNMNLTLHAVVKAIGQVPEQHVGKLAAASAIGSLMGARGNSGVILSQLFRGFGRHLEHKEEITAYDLVRALEVGTETVYKAVRKPVEGTILTVMREASAAATEAAAKNNDLLATLKVLVEQAEDTLARTPEMLPILKQSGVVDAGGQGLLCIFQGWLAAARGEAPQSLVPEPVVDAISFPEPLDGVEIEFGYCTEFLILKPSVDEDSLHDELDALGDSLMVVGDQELLKVHVHTNDPGRALQIGLSYGQLSGIKIENMREQHTSLHLHTAPAARPQTPAKAVGVIAVAAGSGLAEIFTSLGVDVVVSGGQTMNPSTEDLASAAMAINAEQIIILPNNKNIIMAAEQVNEVIDKPVHVIPTASVPQGLSVLMSYSEEPTDMAAMVTNMTRNTSQVKSGQVTVAVRDHNGEVGMIKEGDYIGIVDGDIVVFGQELELVTDNLVKGMLDDEDGLLSIFYGEDVAEEEAEATAKRLAAAFPDIEIELCCGGQPVYHYLVAVE